MSTWTTVLLELLRKQKDRCFWCRCLIAVPDCFEFSELDYRTHWEFGVRQYGVVVHYGRASVDHVVPKWLKGGNRESNLVAACQECNHDRGVLHRPGAFETTGFAEWFLNRRARDLRRKVRRIQVPSRLVTLREPMIEAMQNRRPPKKRRRRVDMSKYDNAPRTVYALIVAERGSYQRERYDFSLAVLQRSSEQKG